MEEYGRRWRMVTRLPFHRAAGPSVRTTCGTGGLEGGGAGRGVVWGGVGVCVCFRVG